MQNRAKQRALLALPIIIFLLSCFSFFVNVFFGGARIMDNISEATVVVGAMFSVYALKLVMPKKTDEKKKWLPVIFLGMTAAMFFATIIMRFVFTVAEKQNL